MVAVAGFLGNPAHSFGTLGWKQKVDYSHRHTQDRDKKDSEVTLTLFTHFSPPSPCVVSSPPPLFFDRSDSKFAERERTSGDDRGDGDGGGGGGLGDGGGGGDDGRRVEGGGRRRGQETGLVPAAAPAEAPATGQELGVPEEQELHREPLWQGKGEGRHEEGGGGGGGGGEGEGEADNPV